ncbi:hypothetical protein [Rhizobium sp. MHM7A]|uniref:hypothetical protein n=1 Tax=Rhizobium sp. MHM7A TaxID=2583233 RepID=UPI001106876D|nr:hypothetical protein [Rhizobium sp. MHM7A]TLX16077.1 hypothetical protein FFR93_01785 [Rhizobium sp. MHM7A]
MLINISRDTFRSFCNSLRHAAGASISNTAMMETVAAALGWRRDALTHHLKTKNLTIEIEDGFLKALVSRVNGQTTGKLQTSDVKPLFDNFTNSNVDALEGLGPGSEQEWQLYRRVALLLESRQADAANEYARQLNEANPAIRLLKGLVGLALDQVGAEASCVSALRNQPALIHALANLSGIEIGKPIAPFEIEQPWDQIAPIKRLPLFPPPATATAFFPKGIGGGLGHKHDEDRYFRVIGGLRRPELKGRAYRAVVAARIALPSDFQRYLEAPAPLMGTKVRCLIDGQWRLYMKSYLKNKYSISTDTYKAFFDVQNDALVIPRSVEEKQQFGTPDQ